MEVRLCPDCYRKVYLVKNTEDYFCSFCGEQMTKNVTVSKRDTKLKGGKKNNGRKSKV